MSITRKRAGRKSWETRQRFNNVVGDFFQALASAPKPVFDNSVTKTMVIERVVKESRKKEVITFSQAYGELSMWLGKAFENISEMVYPICSPKHF
jgi:hypothetical protein